jgi:hypothetical protein
MGSAFLFCVFLHAKVSLFSAKKISPGRKAGANPLNPLIYCTVTFVM